MIIMIKMQLIPRQILAENTLKEHYKINQPSLLKKNVLRTPLKDCKSSQDLSSDGRWFHSTDRSSVLGSNRGKIWNLQCPPPTVKFSYSSGKSRATISCYLVAWQINRYFISHDIFYRSSGSYWPIRSLHPYIMLGLPERFVLSVLIYLSSSSSSFGLWGHLVGA